MNRKLRILWAASIVALICGCRAPGHIGPGDTTKLSIGMTKEEVIKKLGKPEGVSNDGHSETLNYTIEGAMWHWKPLRVKLVDGKVESYQADP